jgi:large repetitive protein
MSFAPSDLGEVSPLATALGLVDGAGNFNGNWLNDPGRYLSSILAERDQRDALLEFLDEALGAEQREQDAHGLVWLPLFSNDDPRVTLYLVIDDRPATHVRIGIGVQVETRGPDSRTRFHALAFRAAKTGSHVSNPILLGEVGGELGLSTDITIDAAPPVAGQAHLGRIGIGVHVPTGAGATPTISLTLGGLQLPGATSPRDISLSVSDLDGLDDAVLELVLGLVQAQAEALGGGELAALAGLIGLAPAGGVPALPLADLGNRGVVALGDWFEGIMAQPSTRAAWLGELAALLGPAANVAGDEVRLTLGVAQVGFGVRVTTGPAGRPVVTPVLSASVVDGSSRARAEVELFRLDLASGAAVAVPRLAVFAQLGRSNGSGTPILAGDPGVDAVRVGIELDEARRPVLLLAADGVTIAGNQYASLDLSSPDALAEAGGTILGDVASDLLDQLGPAGDALRALLGLEPPVGHPGVPTIDVAAFLQDPLAALQQHWRTVLRDHAAAVPTLLATVRGLLADAGAAQAVAGTGTADDPWRFGLVGPVELRVWTESGGDVLHVAIGATYVVDDLGHRCTRVETQFSFGLVRLDLAAGSVVFAAGVDARLATRERGHTRAVLQVGGLELSADDVGIVASWRPETGLRVNASAPNLAVRVDGVAIPLLLPAPGPDGSLTLDADGWAGVERLIGLLGTMAEVPAVLELVRALGWSTDETGSLAASRPRLRLEALAADAEAELRRWLAALLLDEAGRVRDALELAARAVAGSRAAFGTVLGSGRPDDPYRVPLLPGAAAPELTLWLLPNGPRQIHRTGDLNAVRQWRPGDPALPFWQLARELNGAVAGAADVAGLMTGRADVIAGFEALVLRWAGTDGRIVPPSVNPAGITVHRLEGVAAPGLRAAVDLADLLGGAPGTLLHVAVVAADAPLPWPDAPPERVIDLRAPGLAPEAFTRPTAAAGEWFVALAGRAEARLESGDADGVAGQAGRLARVLEAWNATPGVTLLAGAEAGHAARRAAEAASAVSAVITLGTPLGPVSFGVLDEQPAADALRLLRWLLPPTDPAETDDPHIAHARGLLGALVPLLALDDPGRELRPPATPHAPPRAGLEVHAVFGVVDEDAVRLAITAVTAAGLAVRAMAQHEAAPAFEIPTGVRAGVRLPIAAGGAGVTVSGAAVVELVGVDMVGGAPTVVKPRSLYAHLEVRRAGGWLVGGPDPGRGPGPRPGHELRWLEAKLHIPFGDGGEASAELVLHEPRVFGIERDRWIVRPGGGSAVGGEVVTPTLPEVRVLVSHAVAQLTAAAADAAAPHVAALVDVLRGLSLVDGDGGSIPDSIEDLLHDPAGHVSAALSAAARRAQLESGLGQLLAGHPGLDIDIAARRLSLELSSTPATAGLVPWTIQLEADATGHARVDVTLGAPGVSAAGGALLSIGAAPLEASVTWHVGAGAPRLIRLWPDPDGDAMVRALGRLLPAEVLRLGLEYLRGLDDTARDVIDAALDALGLLDAAGSGEARTVLLPAALLEDPLAWLRHPTALGGAGGILAPARVAALLDAAKPLVGVTGAPGEWELADGVVAFADATDGHVRIGLRLDTAGFAVPPGVAERLAMTATAALRVRPDAAPIPSLALSLGLAGAAPGRRAVHVQLNGDLRVFLRPEAGADLSLYPDAPGLGQLAETAVTQALPLILDELAAQAGADTAGRVGEVVRQVGDALGLRSGAPPRFQGTALHAWAEDPAASLAARLPALAAAALNALAAALDDALPAAASASAAGGEITVTVGELSVTLGTAPFRLRVQGNITGIPEVQRLELDIELDASGLRALTTQLGPAEIDAGGVTLRPFLRAAAGNAPAGGRRIELGLGLDAGGNRRVAARWAIDGDGFALVVRDGATEHTDPERVALALVEAVLDLVASFAIATPAMQSLLDTTLPGTTANVRNMLRGVLLADVANPTALDAGLTDPARLLGRVQQLLGNVAGAQPKVAIGGGLVIGLDRTPGNLIELTLGVTGRIDIVQGDITIAIEADSRWIQGAPNAGLGLGLLRQTGGGFSFEPGISVNGVGIRIGRSNAPLLDIGLTLGSIALHVFARVNQTELAGGVQLQLSELGVGVAGAEGGNPIAQGLLADADSGGEPLAPAFSPALAVQKHGSGPVRVSLRAGDGDGPWWLSIQQGFGPIYIEQVGLGTTVVEDQLKRISLLLDGRVSVFGLTAAVDDLQLSFLVASDASPFDASRWNVDLGGLAITADMAGVVLAGGLRKFGEGENVEYVGMLLARFATYGISVYGGYGTGEVDGERYAAFFAFGAINGPIGGPPAFFLTGIGGGLGINRGLIFPQDMSRFGDFVFLKALDPAATPSSNPMEEMALIRSQFPMRRGEFWFAAGISFTSFALVDGIAVVAVAIGDGLEITLLGLARMALPRPQVALVSIELGLIARFSTKEGVLWIQAQLTDNSWLLHESVRLTGGFAFVTWFGGPNRGQFVLTLGGYHPSFHRDGYPEVPRLGFRWTVSDAIVIKGENYFALTSEAIMAGGRLEASAKFGPAWANIVLGADGIVYFDPFRFEVTVYARISAGVTINVLFGRITIKITLGAQIWLAGPRFHGRATVQVGPVSLTVAFGSSQQTERVYLTWQDFVPKYLEEASPGVARAITALPGDGALPPGTGPGGSTETGTADGSAAHPFEVLSEFELTVSSAIPIRRLRIGTLAEANHSASRALGVAPMNRQSVEPRVVLSLRDTGGTDHLAALAAQTLRNGAFPVGVWGKPQDKDDPKIPSGDVIEAVNGVLFEAAARLEDTIPAEIAYNQIETGPRKPLPFVHEAGARAQLLLDAQQIAMLLPDVATDAAMFAAAKPWLALGGHGPTGLAALDRDRAAPPRLGSLTEGLAAAPAPEPALTTVHRPPPVAVDTTGVPARVHRGTRCADTGRA